MGAFLNDGDISSRISEMYDLFPIINEKQDQLAGELSGGQRQQVALARSHMTNPKGLMLDEPTAGVSPVVMDEIFEHILNIKKQNIAVLMVEQNARQALGISDRGYILVTGRNAYEGSGDYLINDNEIRKSFWVVKWIFKRNHTLRELYNRTRINIWITTCIRSHRGYSYLRRPQIC